MVTPVAGMVEEEGEEEDVSVLMPKESGSVPSVSNDAVTPRISSWHRIDRGSSYVDGHRGRNGVHRAQNYPPSLSE